MVVAKRQTKSRRKPKASIPFSASTSPEILIPPGTAVDIYSPANQPFGEWVWTTGYTVRCVSEVSKERHKKLAMREMHNPLTQELEFCYLIGVEQGVFRVFPVVRSHVRVSNPQNKDVWEYPVFIPEVAPEPVILKGIKIADESDKADLAALESVPGSGDMDDELSA